MWWTLVTAESYKLVRVSGCYYVKSAQYHQLRMEENDQTPIQPLQGLGGEQCGRGHKKNGRSGRSIE